MNDGQFYDSKKVRILVALVDITGFSEGEKINIQPVTKESMKSYVGVDGDTSWSKVNDNRYTVTFSLKPGSPSNSYLDILRKTNTPFPVAITNTSEGKYVGGGLNAFITDRPDTLFAGDESPREWKITIPDYSDVLGA